VSVDWNWFEVALVHIFSSSRYYLCLGFDHGYSTPSPMTNGAGAAEEGGGGGGRSVQHTASSSSGGFGMDKGKQDKALKRKGGAKAAKGKDWVLAKKEKRRQQNKETRRDTKYTARKRKDKF
jgi:18S rRNA (guanine1575-N7)-methyltransferase